MKIRCLTTVNLDISEALLGFEFALLPVKLFKMKTRIIPFTLMLILGLLWNEGASAEECRQPSFSGEFCIQKATRSYEAPAGSPSGPKKFCYDVHRYPGESPGALAARIASTIIRQTDEIDREEVNHKNVGPLVDAINQPVVTLRAKNNSKPLSVEVGTLGECADKGMYCICFVQLVQAITREVFSQDPTTSNLNVRFDHSEHSAHAFGYFALAERSELTCGGHEVPMWSFKDRCPAPVEVTQAGGGVCFYKCPPGASVARLSSRRDRSERIYSTKQVRQLLKDEKKRKSLKGCVFLNASHGGIIEDINELGEINTLEGNSASVSLVPKKVRKFEGVGRGHVSIDLMEAVICPYDYSASQVWTDGPTLAEEMSCLNKVDSFLAPACGNCSN